MSDKSRLLSLEKKRRKLSQHVKKHLFTVHEVSDTSVTAAAEDDDFLSKVAIRM